VITLDKSCYLGLSEASKAEALSRKISFGHWHELESHHLLLIQGKKGYLLVNFVSIIQQTPVVQVLKYVAKNVEGMQHSATDVVILTERHSCRGISSRCDGKGYL
jgi:hypothetical protein